MSIEINIFRVNMTSLLVNFHDIIEYEHSSNVT